MAEIQHADPRARRAAILCVAVGAALGTGALLLFERYELWLSAWLVGAPPGTPLGVVLVALLAFCVPVLLTAAWTWRYGVRVLRGNRHPPEGTRLVRDTAVVRDAAARRYGRLYQGLAALFVLVALFIVGVAWALRQLR